MTNELLIILVLQQTWPRIVCSILYTILGILYHIRNETEDGTENEKQIYVSIVLYYLSVVFSLF